MACAGLQRLIKPKHVSGGPAGGFIRGQGSGAQFCGAKLLARRWGLQANLRGLIPEFFVFSGRFVRGLEQCLKTAVRIVQGYRECGFKGH